MTENERSFRRVMNKIGIAMLLFLAIINVGAVFHSFGTDLISKLLPADVAYVVNELGYCVMYLSSFIAPGFILMGLLGKDRGTLMF